MSDETKKDEKDRHLPLISPTGGIDVERWKRVRDRIYGPGPTPVFAPSPTSGSLGFFGMAYWHGMGIGGYVFSKTRKMGLLEKFKPFDKEAAEILREQLRDMQVFPLLNRIHNLLRTAESASKLLGEITNEFLSLGIVFKADIIERGESGFEVYPKDVASFLLWNEVLNHNPNAAF